MAKSSNRSGWILLLMIFIGIVLGGFLSVVISKYVPILGYGYKMGVSTHTWDFNILRLTFGFDININMFTIIGIALALFLYKKI